MFLILYLVSVLFKLGFIILSFLPCGHQFLFCRSLFAPDTHSYGGVYLKYLEFRRKVDWRSWFGSFPADMTVEVVGDQSGKPHIERMELSREI